MFHVHHIYRGLWPFPVSLGQHPFPSLPLDISSFIFSPHLVPCSVSMDHMCELLTLSLYFIIYSSAGNAFLMPVSHCLAQCLDQLIIEHKSVEVGSPCSRQGDIENRKGYSLVLKTRVKIWQKYSRKPWSWTTELRNPRGTLPNTDGFQVF